MGRVSLGTLGLWILKESPRLEDVTGLMSPCSKCLIFALGSNTESQGHGQFDSLSMIRLDLALLLRALGVGVAKLRVRHSVMPQHEHKVLVQFACLR